MTLENNTDEVLEGWKNIMHCYCLELYYLLFLLDFVYQVWRYQVSELSKTRVKVSRILKKYREIIVELEYKPSFEIKNVVDVKDFEELIDVEEEVRVPILFFEDKDKFVFLIVEDNVVYRKIFTG